MRHKKAPPLKPTETPPKLSTDPDDTVDVFGSIRVIERVMLAALPTDNGVTPGQLQDLCGMFVAAMHLRKVTPEYWMANQELPFKLANLAAQVEAEAKLSKLDLPEDVATTLKGSIELSLKEISDLRVKLLAQVKLLQQCPGPGAKIH